MAGGSLHCVCARGKPALPSLETFSQDHLTPTSLVSLLLDPVGRAGGLNSPTQRSHRVLRSSRTPQLVAGGMEKDNRALREPQGTPQGALRGRYKGADFSTNNELRGWSPKLLDLPFT